MWAETEGQTAIGFYPKCALSNRRGGGGLALGSATRGACVHGPFGILRKNLVFSRARPAAALIHQLVRGFGLLRGRGSSGSSAGPLGTSVPVSSVFRRTALSFHPSTGMRSHATPQLCFSSGGQIRVTAYPGTCGRSGGRLIASRPAIGRVCGRSVVIGPTSEPARIPSRGGGLKSGSPGFPAITRSESRRKNSRGASGGGEGRLCTSSVTPPLSESTRNPPGSKARHG